MEIRVLELRAANASDFAFIYDLCEATMRSFVETELGNCFEVIAGPAIQNVLDRGLFSKIYVNDVLVGAVAVESHDSHIQLEELYVEAAMQNQGIGTIVVARLIQQALSLGLPIRLHVLASNDAKFFYEKLGFLLTRSTKQVNFMKYRPANGMVSVA